MDRNKHVRSSANPRDAVHIEIEDEGPAFFLNDVPDPTADENLERPLRTRDMLMRSFMNTVEYNESRETSHSQKHKNVDVEVGD